MRKKNVRMFKRPLITVKKKYKTNYSKKWHLYDQLFYFFKNYINLIYIKDSKLSFNPMDIVSCLLFFLFPLCIIGGLVHFWTKNGTNGMGSSQPSNPFLPAFLLANLYRLSVRGVGLVYTCGKESYPSQKIKLPYSQLV